MKSAGVVALLTGLWACTSSTAEEAPSTSSDGATQAITSPADNDNQASKTFRIAITEDISTDNFWAYMAFEPSVANSFVLGAKHPALFKTVAPTMQVVPDLSDGVFADPLPSGDFWEVEQQIQPDLAWSDGAPVTSHDLAFTFDVVRDFGLGGLWLDYFPESLIAIEPLDDRTVRIVFDTEPGLPLWPYAAGRAPFMPRHFWQGIVEEARGSEDPAATLASAPGMGEPSAGPFIYSGREGGSHITARRNERWHWTGARLSFYENGAVRITNRDGTDRVFHGEPKGDPYLEYTVGPHVDDILYRVFPSVDVAVLSMEQGLIDFVLTPDGLPKGSEDRLLASEGIEVVRNFSNGFGFLGFNLRRSPMSEPGFRAAVDCLIDKAFVANQTLSGQVEELDSLILPANAQWAVEVGSTRCAGLSRPERLSVAVETLADSGFTWEQEPEIANDTIDPGDGLHTPDETPVPSLELLAEDNEENRSAAVYAGWIEDLGAQLGMELAVRRLPTGALVEELFAESPDWDMVITAWDLGDTTVPVYFESLFGSWNDISAGGFNLPGYASDEFDELVRIFAASKDLDQAREIARQMNQLIVEDRPYIPLYTPNLVEAFRAEIEFPFTRALGGLQGLAGAPELVRMR